MILFHRSPKLKLYDADIAAFLSMAVICLTILFSTIVSYYVFSLEQDFKNLTRLTHEQTNLWHNISQRATYLMKEGEKGSATKYLIERTQIRLKRDLDKMNHNEQQLQTILLKTPQYWSFLGNTGLNLRNLTVAPEMIYWMKRIANASPELIFVGFTSWDINKTINLRNGSEVTRINKTIKNLENFSKQNSHTVKNIIILLNIATLIGTIFLWKFFLSPALVRLTEAKGLISERADQAEKYNTVIADLSFQAAKLKDSPSLGQFFAASLLKHLDLELVAISLRAHSAGDNTFSFLSHNGGALDRQDDIEEILQQVVDTNETMSRRVLSLVPHTNKIMEISTIVSGDTAIGAVAVIEKATLKKDDFVKLSFFHSALNILAMTIESQLRKDTEHSLRSVFDAMDQDVYVFDCNEKTVLLNGKSFAQLAINRPATYGEFLRSLSQVANLTPLELIQISQKHAKLINNEQTDPMDIKISKDKNFQLEWRSLPDDEFSVVVTDVSSLREAEMARDQHKNQVIAAFHTTSDAVCVLDENMRIEYHNDAFVKMLPASPKATHLHADWVDLLRLNAMKESLENLDDQQLNEWLSGEQVVDQNLETHLASGLIIIWSRSKTPDNHIVLFARNVTDLRALIEKNAYAERMQALGQLTGGIAHEFNNALMIIQGNIELINKSTNDNAILRHTDPVIRSCITASSMTEKLLSYSRRQTLNPINISPVILQENLLASFEKNRTFLTPLQVNKKTEHSIFADPEHLDSALANLIINAQYAMRDLNGVITIDIEDQHLENFDNLLDGHYICIKVTDEGGGFDELALTHAFEPYFTTKKPETGTGLGLAMVFGFAQQSGGFASVENNRLGAVVTLYLPCGPVLTQHKRKKLDPSFPITEKLTGKSVLVIEDTEFGVDFIVHVLETYHANVSHATSVSGALDIINNTSRPFDFIVSDIDLPDGQGFDVLSHFKSSQCPQCLFITGLTSKDFQTEALKYNADILKKPFTISELITSIDCKMMKNNPTSKKAL